MNFENAVYEVEFRCHFDSVDQAYERLPFLHPSLQNHCSWKTFIHGLQLFRSGQLLRTAEINDDKETKYYVGWKGADMGKFANIRSEVDEEITRTASSSTILQNLGSKSGMSTFNGLTQELERLGYPSFMSFKGIDFSGYNERYDVQLKLMTCPKLKWPIIVEIEKSAKSAEEAYHCEKDLYNLCQLLQLQDRIVKEEPPTLLYQAMFTNG